MKLFSFLKNISMPFLLFLLLAGCDLYGKVGGADTNTEGALPSLLRGEWVYIQPGSSTPAERYVIDNDTLQYGYLGDKTEFDFKGTIRFVSNYNATSGVIIIEYIEAERPSYEKYNGNSFFGIYYRSLATNTVQLANSINLYDLSAPDTATLEEAIGKFTRLNMSKYVGWGNVQPQKRVQK